MKREILDRVLSIFIVALATMVLANPFHAEADEVPPNAAAQSSQDDCISLKDGKWAAGFRTFLKAVKVQMNEAGPGIYISPFDREYYENLSTVFEKISKRWKSGKK
jgi:hypothetical protein